MLQITRNIPAEREILFWCVVNSHVQCLSAGWGGSRSRLWRSLLAGDIYDTKVKVLTIPIHNQCSYIFRLDVRKTFLWTGKDWKLASKFTNTSNKSQAVNYGRWRRHIWHHQFVKNMTKFWLFTCYHIRPETMLICLVPPEQLQTMSPVFVELKAM